MKIVYIITKADEIGGAQIHVRDLSIEINKQGHQALVIVGESGALTKQLEENNIDYIIEPRLKRNISPINDLLCALHLRSTLKKISPDLVSLHSSKAGIVGRLALIKSNIPCVFTAHGWAFADGVSNINKKLYIFIEKIFSHFCKKIITVSKQDKDLALKYNVTTSKHQIVVHNGIPDRSHLFPKSNKFDNNIKLITVARFSAQKDHISLLNALAKIKNKNWTLNLIGKGPLENEIKDQASYLGLSDKINFLGERSDVSYLLSQSDIFILPSNWEGLPRSIIEAMSFSLPIIASNVGGVNEMVSDKNGFLIPRNDIELLGNAINELITNKTLREAQGYNSRIIYESGFNFERMFDKTYSIYNELISEKK
ncbi:glycosyltransferase family 4 protein [Enterobacteriaceae bacterium TYF_5]